MSLKNEKLSQAIKRVYDKLSALSQDDFLRRLQQHADGDFARILYETNVLEVGQIKAEIYDRYTWESIDEEIIPTLPEACSLFFDLEEPISASITFPSNLDLFNNLEVKEVSMSGKYYYHKLVIPNVGVMDFREPYLWSNLWEEINKLQSSFTKTFSVNELKDMSAISANDEKEFLKWAA